MQASYGPHTLSTRYIQSNCNPWLLLHTINAAILISDHQYINPYEPPISFWEVDFSVAC